MAISFNKHIFRQAIGSLACAFQILCGACTVGYNANLLPQLKSDSIVSDDSLGSWIASLTPLSMCAGCLIIGYLTDTFGRRYSHMILTGPFLIGWLFITCASNVTMILIGRIITGLSAGAIRPLAVCYLGEISDPKYRGIFLLTTSLFMNLGIIISHTIGRFLVWRWAACVSLLPSVIGLCIMAYLPETPNWLIGKGRIEEGVKNFNYYRQDGVRSQEELKSVLDKQSNNTSNLTFKNKLAIFSTRAFLKPFFTSCTLFVTVQFCGINTISFYAKDILEKTIGSIDPFVLIMLVDSIRLISSFLCCVFGKQIPRKRTFIVCGFGTALSAYALAAFLFIKPDGLTWVPMTCLIIYTCLSSTGIVTLSFSFIGEIFPAQLRGLGSSLSAAVSYGCLFLSVKSTIPIIDNLGEGALYVMFGSITFICITVLTFLLPDTNGKTLQQIEDEYKNTSSMTV